MPRVAAKSGRLPARIALVSAAFLGIAGWLGWKLDTMLRVRAVAQEARRLMASKEFEAAGPHLQKWVSASPGSGEAALLLARQKFATGQVEQGFAALERASSLGQPSRDVERVRGIALSMLGQHKQAEPILKGLFSAGTAPDPELDEALAKTLLETYQMRAAGLVIDRWISGAPNDAKAYVWKAVVDRASDESNEVLIQDYSKALELDPESSTARFELAGVFVELHRLDEAAEQFREYLRLKPDDPKALLGMGKVAMERGEEEEANMLLEKAAKLAPGDVRPLMELAKLKLRRGLYEESLVFLDRAKKVDEAEAEVPYIRSLVLTRLGKLSEAKAEQDRTNRLRKDAEGLKRIQQALLKAPDDVESQHKAARYMFEHGHPEEGIRWGEKILREHPGHRATSIMMADHYQKVGNPGLANYYRIQGQVGTGADSGGR